MIIWDGGRENTKVLHDNQNPFSYPSKIGEGTELNLQNESRDVLSKLDLFINDKRYFIGDLADESKFRRQMRTISKAHEESKILFATALFLTNYRAEEEKIITLIPINQHNDEKKRILRSTLAGEYQVRNKERGKNFIVYPENIEIVPEGIAAVWDLLLNDDLKLRGEYVGKTIRAIELGSRTIHFATLKWKNGKFQYLNLESGTKDYGCMDLGDYPTEELKNSFVRKIKDDVSSLWNKWETDHVFMLGGGVLKLKRQLAYNFPFHVFHPDPLFANVYGARKLGMIKYGEA